MKKTNITDKSQAKALNKTDVSSSIDNKGELNGN